MKIASISILGMATTFAAESALGALTYYQMGDYRSREDNPFIQGIEAGTIFLETFEDSGPEIPPYNYLTTPNATGWNGLRTGSPMRGVQEDFADGSLGYFWDSSGGSSGTTKLPDGIHFDFTPDGEGRLPEYVGAALLGRGLMSTGPTFNVILVYGSNGIEVTNGEWQIPKPNFDIPYLEEDLFLNFDGIHVPGGISRIHFRDFLEVDHLTYGYAIPEQSAVGLAMGSVFWLLRRKRTCGPSL